MFIDLIFRVTLSTVSVLFLLVVDDLEKYLDPEYVDELLSVTAKTDAIIAGKCFIDNIVIMITVVIRDVKFVFLKFELRL